MEGISIEVDHRFRGPPNSGNGGYVSGIIARHAGFAHGAEVTLRAPTPLSRPLSLMPTDAGETALMDGMKLIAAARPAALEIGPLPVASLAEAKAATGRSIPADKHVLPYCFVCGPGRDHGDGLRIFAGPLDPEDTGWAGVLAAHWVPDETFADDDGLVAPEFIWSALDCPTGYTAIRPDGYGKRPEESILLGRLTARIDRRPTPGTACVLVTRMLHREGRKITAEGVLRDAHGAVIAAARALWITVDKAVLMSAGQE